MDRSIIEQEIEKIYPRSERYHDKLSITSVIHVAEHIAAIAIKETLEKVISIIPGGSVVDPQVICDEIRELMANDGTNEA